MMICLTVFFVKNIEERDYDYPYFTDDKSKPQEDHDFLLNKMTNRLTVVFESRPPWP